MELIGQLQRRNWSVKIHTRSNFLLHKSTQPLTQAACLRKWLNYIYIYLNHTLHVLYFNYRAKESSRSTLPRRRTWTKKSAERQVGRTRYWQKLGSPHWPWNRFTVTLTWLVTALTKHLLRVGWFNIPKKYIRADISIYEYKRKMRGKIMINFINYLNNFEQN